MKLRMKLWYIGCGMYVQMAILSAMAGSVWCVAFAVAAGVYWMVAERRLEAEKKQGE